MFLLNHARSETPPKTLECGRKKADRLMRIASYIAGLFAVFRYQTIAPLAMPKFGIVKLIGNSLDRSLPVFMYVRKGSMQPGGSWVTLSLYSTHCLHTVHLPA